MMMMMCLSCGVLLDDDGDALDTRSHLAFRGIKDKTLRSRHICTMALSTHLRVLVFVAAQNEDIKKY